LATPEEVKRRLPLTAHAAQTVLKSREAVRAILERRDRRLFVVVGPCSIHDVAAAREYAQRLKSLVGAGRLHAVADHARLLREAAHHGGLEGIDQRS